MPTNSSIEIAIKVKDEASNAFNKLKSQLKEFEPAFKSMAVAGTVAFGAIAAVVGTSVKAYADSQAAMARVDTVLKTMNVDFDKSKTVILDAAKAAIKLGFDDEDTAESITKFYQRTNDLTEAQKLNTLAMDLARAKSIDLSTATNLVNLALSGSGRALLQYGIVIKDTASPLEALSILQEKVGGQAIAFADTFSGKMQVLNAQITNLREALGAPFVSILSNVLTKIQPILDKFVEWSEKNPILVKNILLTAMAIAAFIAILGTVGLIIPKIIEGIALLGSAFIFLATNPIGWVIIAISALITASVLLVANWEKVKKFFEETWQGIQIIFTEAIDKIKTEIEGLKTIFNDIIGKIQSFFNALSPANISGTVGDIGKWFRGTVLGFQQGGIVPGPTGVPVAAVVHGGETIIPAGSIGNRNGLSNNIFNFNFKDSFIGNPDEFSNRVIAMINRQSQLKALGAK